MLKYGYYDKEIGKFVPLAQFWRPDLMSIFSQEISDMYKDKAEMLVFKYETEVSLVEDPDAAVMVYFETEDTSDLVACLINEDLYNKCFEKFVDIAIEEGCTVVECVGAIAAYNKLMSKPS